jgi:hypothetical protein
VDEKVNATTKNTETQLCWRRIGQEMYINVYFHAAPPPSECKTKSSNEDCK